MKSLLQKLCPLILVLWGLSFSLTSLAKEPPPYQCMLTRTTIDKRVFTCSGTYLNSTHFLTAAHCINIDDFASSSSELLSTYTVTCPNQENYKAIRAAVHPHRYHPFEYSSPSYFDSTARNSRGGLILNGSSFRSFGTYSKNDIAILLTEKNSLTRFPKLPSLNSPIKYKEHSCRTLSYSPVFCNSDLDGCYRDNYTLKYTIHDYYLDTDLKKCNSITGENCHLENNYYNEIVSDFSPPLLTVTRNIDHLTGIDDHLKQEYKAGYPGLDLGDSGGGILCEQVSGGEVLAGVFKTLIAPNVVSVASHMGYINSILDLKTADDFDQKSRSITFHPDFRDYRKAVITIGRFMIKLDYIEKFLVSTMQATYHSPVSQREKILTTLGQHYTYEPYLDLTLKLAQWIPLNPERVARLFKKNNIYKITYSSDPDDFFFIDWSIKNLTVKDLAKTPGRQLILNRHTKIEEIVECLEKEKCRSD